ncbi:TetR/AcrR family transcriptional regulator [Streptomyces alanosinicus]|uniref:TetR family transcriptional regulator n=1 Tax=Streptomyces alanosinicus TaxID=68171 RepID=A0A919D254_9ACTN|nr:TetR/AcrR family transcriptional regulator [Streptomyces alanosinicus]GHE03463.1 TetR family transcriptional regulator [Streptomyces alanosinicus]
MESERHGPERDAGRGILGAEGPEVTDLRLVRGARARQRVARHAVDIASLDGLDGLSIGRLAADLGLSKSGVQTLFRTKENLQLAAAESAHREFERAVVRPTRSFPAGSARLRALTEHWIVYAQTPLFAGGCFWSANLPAYDSRPGAVRDALLAHRDAWLKLIGEQLRRAVGDDEIAPLDVELTVFQLDAVCNAANIAMRLGDDGAARKVRRVVEGFLRGAR